jgi:hypothetical protein
MGTGEHSPASRRINNPPHSRKSAVRHRFDGTPTLGRRVANPPQDTILPHKAPAFIPSPCAAAAHPKQVTNLPHKNC